MKKELITKMERYILKILTIKSLDISSCIFTLKLQKKGCGLYSVKMLKLNFHIIYQLCFELFM